MLKTIKKVLLGSISILLLSFLTWTTLLLNPSWSYAHETNVEFVTIHHNSALDEEAKTVVKEAIEIIKKSTIYTPDVKLDLCLNDDEFYKNIHPLYGKCLGYAVTNKVIIKNCKVNFKEDLAQTQWEENNREHRKFKLTWLIAHELMHTLQYLDSPNFFYKSPWKIHWQLEGHADYIAREFQNDGQLKNKIDFFEKEKLKDHIGYPVFKREDGTCQILSYFKYSLVVQYLIEEKNLSFDQLLKVEDSLDELYEELLAWRNK